LYTLITSANSAQAYQLKNKLNSADIILGDYLDLPAFMLASAKMINLPDPKSVSYAHEMLTFCLDNKISTIYPLRQEEQNILKTSEQLFKEYGVALVIGG
jgi:hypothetical protein